MGSGRFNERETEAQKEKPKPKETHKVTEQIRFSSWTLKWALSRGAAEGLLPRGCDLPVPGVRSLLRRGRATEQSGQTWRPGSGGRPPQLSAWPPAAGSGRAEPKSLGPLGADPRSGGGTVRSHELAALQAPAVEIRPLLVFLRESGEGREEGEVLRLRGPPSLCARCLGTAGIAAWSPGVWKEL